MTLADRTDDLRQSIMKWSEGGTVVVDEVGDSMISPSSNGLEWEFDKHSAVIDMAFRAANPGVGLRQITVNNRGDQFPEHDDA